MRTIIFRKDGSNVGGSSFSGGTLTSPLVLAGDPTQPLEAATKQYVDNGLASLNANNLTSGAVPIARLPAFTGDVSSSAGTNILTLSNTGVAAGTYAKVTVDAKGRVTAGGTLVASDIPNLHWSKITDGKPTTLSGYGITDGVNKSGDTMTGPLTLSGNATSPLHAVPLQQLSEVASGNNGVEFIASGTIPNAGLTVGLNANGTVSVITENIQSGGMGAPTKFNHTRIEIIRMVYDPINQKVILAYRDNVNSGYGTVRVGTVSGNSISFGSPTIFNNGNTPSISMAHDSANNKVVIAYSRNNSDSYGTAIVGTVSGNSISFGSPVVFSNTHTFNISAVYDSANQKVVIAYNSGSQGRAIVGTVSGTSISFGTPVIFNNSTATVVSTTYDSISQKIIIAYRDVNNGGYGTAIVGTVSGNSILFGSPVVFSSISTYGISTIYSPANQRVVIAYRNINHQGIVVVGAVSGNSISFSTPVFFHEGSDEDGVEYISARYDSANQKVIITYYHTDEYNAYIIIKVANVSGNNISFNSPVTFNVGATLFLEMTTVYDSVNQKVVIAYYDESNVGAFARVYSPAIFATNKNTFIGISQNSATDSATVSVKIKGQVDSNQSGLTPGQLYYVSNNGTLTTTSTNNPLVGVAISANKLLITNWSIN